MSREFVAEAQDRLSVQTAILLSRTLKYLGEQRMYIVAKPCCRRERTVNTRAADRANADYISEPCWHRQRRP